jgi:hypothetical protein
MCNLKRSFYLEKRYLCFLIFVLYSCNNSKTTEDKINRKPEQSEKSILQIDPRTFTRREFKLSDIADDINYVLLDNKMPVGQIFSFIIRNNSIFMSIEDMQLIKFDIKGKNPQQIGKNGRGPGEYLYCTYYTVDNETGNIYVRGKREAILVYSPNGYFIRELPLPHCNDGSLFHSMEFLDTSIFIAQYIDGGHAKYNWIIIDTLGKVLSNKPNYLPPFISHTGQAGGIYKFKDKISHWETYNDTVFTISSDFNYKSSIIFPPGNYRRRVEDIKFNSPQEFIEGITKICRTINLFETNNFWVYRYMFNMVGIAFINKRTEETLLNFKELKSWGIDNDLDGGTVFQPEGYYTENSNEYLIGVVSPYKLIVQVASESFINSKPKYPKYKKKLEELVNNLKETDNPVLMMVKLKKEE